VPTPEAYAVLKTNPINNREKHRERIFEIHRAEKPKMLKKASRTTQKKLENPSTLSPVLKTSPCSWLRFSAYRYEIKASSHVQSRKRA
jgi:hypothetical protein